MLVLTPTSLPRVQRTSGKKCVHCASIKLCSPSARTLEGDKGVPPFGILIFYSSTNFILMSIRIAHYTKWDVSLDTPHFLCLKLTNCLLFLSVNLSVDNCDSHDVHDVTYRCLRLANVDWLLQSHLNWTNILSKTHRKKSLVSDVS